MKDITAQISGDEAVTSVAAAKELLDRHNQVKAEIDAREETVMKITRAGNKLVQQGHYAKTEVSTHASTIHFLHWSRLKKQILSIYHTFVFVTSLQL